MSRSSRTRANSLETDYGREEFFPTGSSPDGRAKETAFRARDLAWTIHALDYGAKFAVWLANFDRADCCWKTAQTSLLSTTGEILEPFSGTWPRSGTMRSGIAFQLPPLTHPTSVIASGSSRLWPTMHGMANPNNPRRQGPSGNELGRAVNQSLMPTLTARDWRSGLRTPEGLAEREKQSRGVPLNEWILYPTLRTTDATHAGPNQKGSRGDLSLTATILLPTLTASRRSGLQSHGKNVFLGSLNPTWCEWFMGLPSGWSASTPSET